MVFTTPQPPQMFLEYGAGRAGVVRWGQGWAEGKGRGSFQRPHMPASSHVSLAGPLHQGRQGRTRGIRNSTVTLQWEEGLPCPRPGCHRRPATLPVSARVLRPSLRAASAQSPTDQGLNSRSVLSPSLEPGRRRRRCGQGRTPSETCRGGRPASWGFWCCRQPPRPLACRRTARSLPSSACGLTLWVAPCPPLFYRDTSQVYRAPPASG